MSNRADGVSPAGLLPEAVLRGGGRRRAGFAADPARSRGRIHPEPESRLRSNFQRDRDRIVHCNAFRRLKHKTQVFIDQAGDHFRTRLTHTLEVAQIARSIAVPLGLDEDLAEALALAHDLGHPPFGHAGERALDRALSGEGGFDHNAQSLRVVTTLERRYTAFDGLNLSLETLEGLIKHNGPLTEPNGGSAQGAATALPYAISAFEPLGLLRLDRYPSLEAQVAAVADDIAYDTHDIEDGIRAGLIELADLHDAPMAGAVLRRIDDEFPGLETPRAVHELVRRLIDLMIGDVLAETVARLRSASIRTADDVVAAGVPLVGFSPGLAETEQGLKTFLFERLYRHPAVAEPVAQAETIVAELFAAYRADPAEMAEGWHGGTVSVDMQDAARLAADYAAGMTDRFALSEHRRLFDATPDLG